MILKMILMMMDIQKKIQKKEKIKTNLIKKKKKEMNKFQKI